MTHEILKTDKYLLVLSDEEIGKKDWFLYFYEGKKYVCRRDNSDVGNYEEDNGELLEGIGTDYYSEATFTYIVYLKDCKKIIAHKPLKGAPYLDGVDVLPEFEDEVERLATHYFRKSEYEIKLREEAFKAGYNKAKETTQKEIEVYKNAYLKLLEFVKTKFEIDSNL